MLRPTPTVYVVDDDPEVLTATERLLLSADYDVVPFQSPQRFLESFDPGASGCVVLDLAMPGFSGLDLQRALAARGSALRLVFLTGRGDIGSSVQAMKHGAVDFLTKPVNDAELLAAVQDALEKSVALQRTRQEQTHVADCLAALTARERQVLEHIMAGRLNKQIAADLGTVEKTIKFHRANLMRKMGARSVADLVRLAERAGVGGPGATH
jgi:FixJ family two-component response regulator